MKRHRTADMVAIERLTDRAVRAFAKAVAEHRFEPAGSWASVAFTLRDALDTDDEERHADR